MPEIGWRSKRLTGFGDNRAETGTTLGYRAIPIRRSRRGPAKRSFNSGGIFLDFGSDPKQLGRQFGFGLCNLP